MVAIALLAAPSARADQATRTTHDVATIENGSGQARILFRVGDLSDLGPIVIKRATLRIPITGEAASRALELRVHNLTTDWSPGSADWNSGWSRAGGDFEDAVYGGARIDLSRGATTVSLDVSPLLKDTYEMGVPSYGLLLTADTTYTDGFDSEDLSRFAGLSSAVLDLDYVRVSRAPRSVLDEDVRGR
jgi:hypothetical protein